MRQMFLVYGRSLGWKHEDRLVELIPSSMHEE